MAIIQISKIQVRSGNLVDLPQLDEAELGWASDDKRLFIGKTTPNENIEILTSYSNIDFSQLTGSYGNLNITNPTVGQVLVYDSASNAWINAGGNVEHVINLGDVANVKIGGEGGIGYVLETDGTGNLSWTPKGSLYTNIKAISSATTGIMTVANTTPYTNGQSITISSVQGTNANTVVNGQTFYVKLATDFATSGNVELYTTSALSVGVNTTTLTATANTGVATAVVATGGGGGGSGGAGGTTYSVQYNYSGVATGDPSFTWNNSSSILSVTGTANVSGNINSGANVVASRLVSNIATGTSPLVVTSTTRVANLNVATSGVANTVNDAAQPNITSVGTLTTVSVSGNANIGNIGTAGIITATGNANVGNLGTAGLITATGNIRGGNLVTGGVVSATGNIIGGNIIGGNLSTSGNANVGNLGVNGLSLLGPISNVSISGGNSGQLLATNGSGVLTWVNPTGGYYLHTQSSASTTWTIVHNLNNQYVSVNPIDNTGNSYMGRYDYPTVNYTNANAVILTFSSAVNGYCAVVGGGFTYANGSGGNSSPGGLNTYIQFNDGGILGGQSSFTFNKSTGLVTATTFAGSGANLTGLNASNLSSGTVPSGRLSGSYTIDISGTATVATTAGSATTAGTVTTAAQPNITSTGTLTTLSVSGNANVGNLGTAGLVTVTGNITGGNINTGGIVSATGNINGGNINGTILSASGNVVTPASGGRVYAGTLTDVPGTGQGGFYTGAFQIASDPNSGADQVLNIVDTNYPTKAYTKISSNGGGLSVLTVGAINVTNVFATGVVSATGNVTGGNLSVTGNANIGNIGTGGLITATGNIQGGNLVTGGRLSVTGNANIGNIGTAGQITATGNITTSGYFLGTFAGNISASGNISPGNIVMGPVAEFISSNNIITSSIMMGKYTSASSLGVTGNYYFSYNNQNNAIGLTDATSAASIATSLNTSIPSGNINMAIGTSYGNTKAGLGFVSGTQTQILNAVVGLPPQYTGNINAVVVGYATVGPRMVFSDYDLADDSANSIRMVANITRISSPTFSVTGNVVATNIRSTANLTATGTLITTTLNAGANTTSGSITGNWQLTPGSKLVTFSADLAEYYEADMLYEPGTVLEFGGEKEVTLAQDGTTRVAGVVSTNPAYVMNTGCPGYAVAIALQGRVPCKVRGKINKGDLMVSGGDGYARPANQPTVGMVLGKAIASYEGTGGVIEIAIGRL